MNKLTKREYVSIVADTAAKVYGSTLREDDTDIKLAKAIVKALEEYLYFRSESRESLSEYNAWKRSRVAEG